MNTYIMYGKSSSEYAAGMVSKPHNRIEVVQPLVDQFNMKIREFLFTNGESFNWLGVCEAEDDTTMEAVMGIILSSGNWENMHWSRAYNSLEYKAIYEKAHEGMASYVTTMQVAGRD